MTHDELLAYINKEIDQAAWTKEYYPFKSLQSLRAVVELHKPFDYELAPDVYKLVCTNCQMGAVEQYPCQTIQKIMDELK